MSELLRCTGCERHVHTDETQCPFCAARSFSKVVLPALALMGLTACPGPAVKSVYAGPPPEDIPAPVEEPALEEGEEAPEAEADEPEAVAEPSPDEAGGEDE